MTSPRPRHVIWFERLFHGSFLLGLAVIGLDSDRINTPEVRAAGGLAAVLTMLVATWAFTALFIWLTAHRGKNWARWIMSIMTVAGLVGFVPQLVQAFKFYPLSAAINVVQLLMQLGALVLVFSDNAAPFFSKDAAPGTTTAIPVTLTRAPLDTAEMRAARAADEAASTRDSNIKIIIFALVGGAIWLALWYLKRG
jgi:hypothetical protein